MRLRRSRQSEPGLTRRRRGRGFQYLDASGRPVTDPELLDRIRALAIPPAWTDVWICPYPNGHLQATGTDAAGRRQYRYHPEWTARQDKLKFTRAQQLGDALPELRRQVSADLAGRGLSRRRVLSCTVRLLDLGLFRIGGEEYAREHETYGLATLRRDHVHPERGGIRFDFKAKHSLDASLQVSDPAILPVVRALLRRPDPSPELLAWWASGQRCWRDVRSEHINEFLRELSGQELTAKDFRTWHATVLMAMELDRIGPAKTRTARKRLLAGAYRQVAEALNNTPAVTRSSYVDPRIVDVYEGGVTIGRVIGSNGRRSPTEPCELVPLWASDAVVRLLAD